MKRNGRMQRFVKMLGLIAVLAMLGVLLMACGEEEDIGGSGSGNTPPAGTPTVQTPGSTPTAETPAVTPTTETPDSTPTPEAPTATPEPAVPAIDYPSGPDDLVLRIEYEGGFVMLQHLLVRLPVFSLTGDGCFVHEGPQIAIYPPPALPNLLETCVDEDGMQAILQAAKDAGLLDGDAHYPVDIIADAVTTVFTINANGESFTVSAYALGMEEGSETEIPGVSEEDMEARAKLSAFFGMMLDVRSWLPEGSIVTEERFFEIERLQIVAQPVDSPSAPMPDAGIEPGEIAWPLETPLAAFGEQYLGNADMSCGVVEGEELGALLRVMENANTLTHWTSEGESYYLYLRPLLTGETGCPAELGS